MRNLELNYENVLPFISEDEINQYSQRVKDNHNKLHNKTGKGSEFTDWITYPINYDKEEYARLKKSVEYIKANADALIVLGIGGSYLGARAVIEALTPIF
ncbi:MAG: glucose-6-phosphate isomerase, partial [Clostridia bacterium]|nr:glucose-6-phosphate isomerase [Clostridia bacterium]